MATNAYFLNQYKLTTLSVAGGIDDSQTDDIVVQDITGVEIAKPGICAITYADPIDTTKIEYITYTSINDSTKALVGVTRGAEGSTAKAHDNGAVVAFSIISESHINNLATALTIEDDETDMVEGVKDEDTMASDSATALATQQSIKAYVDNGQVTSLSRQAIINGNFDVWQRGTTSTPADVTVVYSADRWNDYISRNGGTLPTLSRTREAFTVGELAGSYYFNRLTTNGAGTSMGDASYSRFAQRIEHGTRYLCGNGKKVTVSFYARSSIANKRIGITLIQNYGSGGSPTAQELLLNPDGAITLTSTLTKYTATFTTNTLTGKTFGTANDDFIQIQFTYQWGVTRGGTDVEDGVTAEDFGGAGTIDIAQVQLCAGEVALPFQPKSFEEELRACQRYYEKSYPQSVAPGTALDENLGYGTQFTHPSATGGIVTPYKVSKRTIAGTVTVYDAAGTAGKVTGFTGAAFVDNQSLTYLAGKENGFYILNTTANTTNTYFNWSVSDEL
jgi:hypothetical protein